MNGNLECGMWNLETAPGELRRRRRRVRRHAVPPWQRAAIALIILGAAFLAGADVTRREYSESVRTAYAQGVRTGCAGK